MLTFKLLKKSAVISEIVAEDISQAEGNWIKEEQEDMNEGKKLEGQLRLFEDSGTVRCRGRIGRSYLPYTSKFPALLPRCCEQIS